MFIVFNWGFRKHLLITGGWMIFLTTSGSSSSTQIFSTSGALISIVKDLKGNVRAESYFVLFEFDRWLLICFHLNKSHINDSHQNYRCSQFTKAKRDIVERLFIWGINFPMQKNEHWMVRKGDVKFVVNTLDKWDADSICWRVCSPRKISTFLRSLPSQIINYGYFNKA